MLMKVRDCVLGATRIALVACTIIGAPMPPAAGFGIENIVLSTARAFTVRSNIWSGFLIDIAY